MGTRDIWFNAEAVRLLNQIVPPLEDIYSRTHNNSLGTVIEDHHRYLKKAIEGVYFKTEQQQVVRNAIIEAEYRIRASLVAKELKNSAVMMALAATINIAEKEGVIA